MTFQESPTRFSQRWLLCTVYSNWVICGQFYSNLVHDAGTFNIHSEADSTWCLYGEHACSIKQGGRWIKIANLRDKRRTHYRDRYTRRVCNHSHIALSNYTTMLIPHNYVVLSVMTQRFVECNYTQRCWLHVLLSVITTMLMTQRCVECNHTTTLCWVITRNKVVLSVMRILLCNYTQQCCVECNHTQRCVE